MSSRYYVIDDVNKRLIDIGSHSCSCEQNFHTDFRLYLKLCNDLWERGSLDIEDKILETPYKQLTVKQFGKLYSVYEDYLFLSEFRYRYNVCGIEYLRATYEDVWDNIDSLELVNSNDDKMFKEYKDYQRIYDMD